MKKLFVCSFVPSSFAKKKIFRARPFASKLLFFVPRISLFCRLHTASSLRTHYYVIIVDIKYYGERETRVEERA
jgi:hypothetical protein